MSEHNISAVAEADHKPTTDSGKVRLGGLGPVFKDVADAGKVRLGGLGPLFR